MPTACSMHASVGQQRLEVWNVAGQARRQHSAGGTDLGHHVPEFPVGAPSGALLARLAAPGCAGGLPGGGVFPLLPWHGWHCSQGTGSWRRCACGGVSYCDGVS